MHEEKLNKVICDLEKVTKSKNCPFVCFDALELLKEQSNKIETLEKVNSINLNPKWPYVFNNYRKVVLCKDCRWWHESKLEQFKGFGKCGQANGIALKPHDWFCADGELKG